MVVVAQFDAIIHLKGQHTAAGYPHSRTLMRWPLRSVRFLAPAVIVLLLHPDPALAAAIFVPDDLPTLQAAVDSIWSRSVDTIYVRPGVVTTDLTARDI